MDVGNAVLDVLREAEAPLHWTVIQDRVLKAGAIDPFTTPNVRRVVGDSIRGLVGEGAIVKVDKGTYAIVGADDDPPRT